MVAEHASGAVLAHQAQHPRRVRAAVDEIADRLQLVGRRVEADSIEQPAKLGGAALNVADEDAPAPRGAFPLDHHAAGLTALQNSSADSVLSTSPRRTQPRRAIATPRRTFCRLSTECASVEITKRIPRSRAARSQRGSMSKR